MKTSDHLRHLRMANRPDELMIRLYNYKTKKYLHLDGETETACRDYSWLGYKYQARTLLDRQKATGKSWPYKVLKRNEEP